MKKKEKKLEGPGCGRGERAIEDSRLNIDLHFKPCNTGEGSTIT